MRVLVVGAGGREHSLVWKISTSSLVDEIFCAPGNGGTAEIASNIDIKAENTGALIHFAKKEKIDLTVIGPEGPLVNGIMNAFKGEGLTVFGPSKNAAMIEGSKVYAKILMDRVNIPQAAFQHFHTAEKATEYLKEQNYPLVIKASGLAAGKGVIIVHSQDEAKKIVQDIMVNNRFGKAGKTIIIEEFLRGEEVSLLVLSDGKSVLPFVSSQDHKQAYDDDRGPNTGGMGAYAPAPILDETQTGKVIDTIIMPVLDGLRKEGIKYQGVLYAGLIITDDGPKVLEFNCRFGDPETQAILPLLKSDLAEALLMTTRGELKHAKFEWSERSAVCVVLASGGYPDTYEKGKEITGLEKLKGRDDVVVFHAGTRKDRQRTITAGGRVLGVTGVGKNLNEAIEVSYSAIGNITFNDMHYRKDIGQKGLKQNRL